MPRKKRPESELGHEAGRAANGEGTVYLGADGYWHGRVTMGLRDDGKPDRRHVKRKNTGPEVEAEVQKEVDKLIAARDSGNVPKIGRVPTVEKWLIHWVENIEARSARFKTLGGHRTAVYKYLIPGVGAHKMNAIKAEHLERLYTKLEKDGKGPYTIAQVHRTARAAFNEAIKREDWMKKNPATLAKHVTPEAEEKEPFEADEVRRIIAASLKRRNGVRFVIALALGIRQGEALGIKWERLDRQRHSLRFPKQLQRHTWQHGCEDLHQCGASWHKRQPCPKPCKRHKRPCPPPCAPTCTDHARHCPKRHSGGLVEVDVKSRAGKRGLVIHDVVWQMIEAHEAAQAAERERAGSVWQEGGWMFTQPDGRPIDSKADRAEWHAVLAEAGVREARLHDARHTMATILALLEVAPRVAMDHMGWSNPAMMLNYQHITDAMRQDTANRVGGYLFGETEPEKPQD